MQFTIVLDGTEGPIQLRRISAAVLALGGQEMQSHVHVSVTTSKPVNTMPTADLPDTGADAPPALPVSAAPLAPPVPPAPLAAAADLFPTVPAAPAAGVPMPPTVAAPPAPTDSASAAPPAPAATSTPANSADLDKAGLPWDARIHSGSREKIKDGTWRQRRNLPEGERERVEAELRALMALPANVTVGDAPTSAVPLPPPAPPATPAAPATEVATTTAPPAIPATAPASASAAEGNVPPVPPAPLTSAPGTAAIPTPPAPPAPTAAAPNAPATGANPFSALMMKITAEVTARRLTEAQVHAALAEQGLQPNQMSHLAARHDLAALVSAKLDHYLAGGQ
jgi:hypothetical protein